MGLSVICNVKKQNERENTPLGGELLLSEKSELSYFYKRKTSQSIYFHRTHELQTHIL